MDVDQWYRDLNNGPVKIEGFGTTSKKEIAYYYRKYILLRDNGFFSGIDTEHYLSGRLSADQIKSSLANTRQVTFEVVDFCNLECAYCTYGKFYNNYDRREKNKLSTAPAKTFLNYLLDLMNSPLNDSHGRPFYIGFYGGEPLLNFPFIREIVDYVRQLKAVHNRFCFNMTTNGLLLERYMDFLEEHDFLLLISLDGNEYNNSYRVFKDGTPAYQQILENVNALKSKYPEYFESRVNFNAVFHNRNSVSDIHRYFKTHFNKVPTISELNPSGISDSMREEFRKTYANINENLFQVEDYSLVEKDMFIRLPNIKGVSTFLDQCSGFVFNDYNELLASGNEGKEEVRVPTGTCMPFSRKVFITVKGKILPCEQIGYQYGLGAVDENNVELDFEKIARTYNRYYDKLKNQCCTCANAEACFQCIFYLNPEKPNPKCLGLFNKEELSQFLATQVSYLEENPHTYTKIMKEVRIE
ncbi:MAG: radical SAM peptide maturase [Candidatus Aminicenantes bacterium]|nr:radical SAM peptide maturase [Candidatus Aminicenantes bacterium]NIM81974.1 radical SAM peptide maturase [Candidatus Aminicenantes bacterium]NIN21362.1 radical SAM peptide maturase [Candidatus Aminicenantes bacterium]NIN45183.1 radical SAM peptide maturase [Candidatus Aminicenantes bacterium]NIN88000.1 radical SAM peptide maturase [Candidatus Aminicenantes bacterium]